MHVCVPDCVHACVCVHACLCACLYACMSVCLSLHMCMCIYLYVCIPVKHFEGQHEAVHKDVKVQGKGSVLVGVLLL